MAPGPTARGARRLTIVSLAAGALTLALAGLTLALPMRSAPASSLLPERARSADGFVDTIGVNTRLAYLDTVYGSGFSTIIAPMLQASGIRHVRDGGTVLSDRQWMRTVYDRANRLATTLGRRIGFTVVMSPADGSCDMTHPPVEALLTYLNVANIDAFEGPNERDVNPPCRDTGLSGQWALEAGTFQRALFERVHASPLTRHIPVVGASLGAATSSNSPSVLGDQSASVDFGNQHSYPGGSYPSKNVTHNLTVLASVFGAKAHYATETGYHNNTAYEPRLQQGVSELSSGKYMSRLFFEYFNRGVVRTYVHEFIDEAGMPGSEAHYGLLRADGAAKPQFTAIRNTIDILQEPGAAFEPSSLSYSLGTVPDTIHHTLLQKKNGTFYLILWQEVASYRVATATTRGADLPIPPVTVTLTLGASAAHIRQYNPLASAIPFRAAANVQTVPLAVPDHTLIVEITP